MTFYNTTNEKKNYCLTFARKAKTQEIIIINFFTIAQDFEYSPSDLSKDCIGLSKFPLTSIRRALSDLTKQGKLIKTKNKKIGLYGRHEYLWRLK